MSIEEYFRHIASVIDNCPGVSSSSVTYDKRTEDIGFIRGEIWFPDESVLYFREFVQVQNPFERYMYVYHYQSSERNIIFRYDNTPHFPNLKTFPHHKHESNESNVIESSQPDLPSILEEILFQT